MHKITYFLRASKSVLVFVTAPAYSSVPVDYRRGIPSIVHLQTLRFSPPPSPKLRTSLCRSCLVCKVSVFTYRFVNLLAKRRRDHEAKKAVAAVAEGEGQKKTSSTTPSDVDTAGTYVQTLSYSCNVMGYDLSINTCSR